MLVFLLPSSLHVFTYSLTAFTASPSTGSEQAFVPQCLALVRQPPQSPLSGGRQSPWPPW